MELFKSFIVLALLAILFSLGRALFHLTSGKGSSEKMAQALTWRISLSVGLLLLILLAAHQGWIAPHGLSR